MSSIPLRLFKIKIVIPLFLLWLGNYSSQAQTIMNTEVAMHDLAEKPYSLHLNLAGDFQFGNVKLSQVNTSLLMSKKKKNHLFRLMFGYDYLSQNTQTINSDYSGQFRYNHFINRKSIVGFVQIQNAKALSMRRRVLAGLALRSSIYLNTKNNDYFDISLGVFRESELYDIANGSKLAIENLRVSFSSFASYHLTDNIRSTFSIYFQQNANSISDFRLYNDSRIYFDMKKISLYVTWQLRYHNTPYVDITSADNELMFGIEYSI